MNCNSQSQATPPPLENDDLLAEILLRLSPEPSSLPRVSLVCKRWRHLVSDSDGFLRRFRARHRAPPLLGFFTTGRSIRSIRSLRFVPALDPPNRVPPGRFYLRIDDDGNRVFAGCRQGLLLILNVKRPQAWVWDPLTGDQRCIGFPPGLEKMDRFYGGSLLPAATPGEFQVALARTDSKHARAAACVYSSETGLWGDPILISSPLLTKLNVCFATIGALVEGSLYWPLSGESPAILEFDLCRRSLVVMPVPPGLPPHLDLRILRVMPAEGGGLGLLSISISSWEAKLWRRETGCGAAAASWVLTKTFQLDKLFSLTEQKRMGYMMVEFTEDYKTLFLWSYGGVFMLQLDSMQFTRFSDNDVPNSKSPSWILPFSSVYYQR